MTYLAAVIFGMGLDGGLLWALPNEFESSGTTAVMGMIIGAAAFVYFRSTKS